jgi:catechol 2,3-dioxygenase-like lactoylglutathione lyase family enzyme
MFYAFLRIAVPSRARRRRRFNEWEDRSNRFAPPGKSNYRCLAIKSRFNMRLHAAICLSLFALTVVPTASPQQRPRITGISHLSVYTSKPDLTDRYYREVIGAAKEPDPENPHGARYYINATQFIEVLPLPEGAGINRLDHTAWNTDSAEGMRKYLAAKGWQTPASVEKGSDGSRWFEVKDPEGNRVQFVQPPSNAEMPEAPNLIGHHIIHVGFHVNSRAAEDKFYRDLLGFRPYWFGGMQEGQIDWVSQQTPDGRDWLEYMVSPLLPSTAPADQRQRQLGVMDHLSIGEPSVSDAFKVLQAGDRLTDVRHDQSPKIGKDGKWQFNLYDPDGTRAELMNFKASEKPCCSPFTAEDPDVSEK